MNVLVLGGTGEGRRLAAALHGRPGYAVTSSLAGRVTVPTLPDGDVRMGGFGGVDGLVEWLRRHEIDAVVDATHPFATRMSANAVAATAASGLPTLGERVFLTTGGVDLAAYTRADHCQGWVRGTPVDNARIWLDRIHDRPF